MVRILTTLKPPKVGMATLEKPLTHSIEDLMSKMLLVLIPIELNMSDLELLSPMKGIFFKIKKKPLSKKSK